MRAWMPFAGERGEPTDLTPAEQAKALRRKTGWRHTASVLLTGPVGPCRPLTRFVHRPKWPELAKSRQSTRPVRASGGAVAQLGERRNRTAEVRGSNPLGSTKNPFAVLRSNSLQARKSPKNR